ncbi:hypothetical protein [Vitiosangium sp. GDMCC 1.1324]|nr:hypothetical protein [Vitiosangium sp. GDMCC 1.1324]
MTSEGMFFADAVAGLLSMDRVAFLRRLSEVLRRQPEPESEEARDFMG